jgi:hypothetical protein
MNFKNKIKSLLSRKETFEVKFILEISGQKMPLKVRQKGRDYKDAYNSMIKSVKFYPQPE